MTIEEKIDHSLAEMGVSNGEALDALFAETMTAMTSEREALLAQGAKDERERESLARAFRDRWLARHNGILAKVDQHWLKLASPPLKPVAGRRFNELRKAAAICETAVLVAEIPLHPEQAHSPDAYIDTPIRRDSERRTQPDDLTLPGIRHSLGSLHPITRVQREIEDIFINLGFAIESGPEIESVEYNFDALNIPESHPSRDDWDTLYIDSQTVLRTHTSPVQIRAMRQYGAPLHILIPGKCYRRDNPDSTHSPMFHQIEGLAVGENITFADLKGTLDFFARRFFGGETRTSFHPSYFPFTEPSGEVAISCPFCGGAGCRVCKQSGWIEVMGCGMVHPAVLRNGGIDPQQFTGWAFGLGIERYAMMKYGINDIQLFYQSDVRFLGQF